MTNETRMWVATGVILLNCYSVGAHCVERFVNYETWPFIPGSAFRGYHREQQPRILVFVVAPVVLSLVLQVCLVIGAPDRMLSRIGWVMLGASLTGFAVTIAFQIPIHKAFNLEGYSPASMRKLLRTDWLRKAMDLVRTAATVALLRYCIHW